MSIKAMATGSLALFFLACGPTDQEATRSITGGAYSNKAIGLSMTFPGDWLLKTDQKFGAVTADIVAAGAPIGGFSPNVNVIYSAHSGPSQLSEVIPTLKTQLRNQYPDVGPIHDSLYAIDGTDVAEIQYETTVNGSLLHFMQLLFFKNSQDVTCTFTDRPDDFQVNADLKSIKASVHIK